MKCPVCKTQQLSPVDLEQSLSAAMCEGCGGYWLSAKKYFEWLTKQRPHKKGEPFSEITFEVKDSQDAKICPECGRVLIKYKVGHGMNFFVDNCPSCNGVWLDKNEWNALKGKHLHDAIHRVFTTSWQHGVRDEDMKKHFEQLYVKRFGKADYDEIKRIREWLSKHPNRDALLAFVDEKD